MCYGSGSQFSFLGVIWIWTFKDVHFLLPPVEKTLKNPFPSVLVAKLNILKTWIFKIKFKLKEHSFQSSSVKKSYKLRTLKWLLKGCVIFIIRLRLKEVENLCFISFFFLSVLLGIMSFWHIWHLPRPTLFPSRWNLRFLAGFWLDWFEHQYAVVWLKRRQILHHPLPSILRASFAWQWCWWSSPMRDETLPRMTANLDWYRSVPAIHSIISRGSSVTFNRYWCHSTESNYCNFRLVLRTQLVYLGTLNLSWVWGINKRWHLKLPFHDSKKLHSSRLNSDDGILTKLPPTCDKVLDHDHDEIGCCCWRCLAVC